MKLLHEKLNDEFNIFNNNQDSIDNDLYYIKEENNIVGIIELWEMIPTTNTKEIKILIFSEFRRKGYGTKALNILYNTILKDGTTLIFKSPNLSLKPFLYKNGFILNEEYLYSSYLYKNKLIKKCV